MYVIGILRNIKKKCSKFLATGYHAACHTDGPRLEYVIEYVRRM